MDSGLRLLCSRWIPPSSTPPSLNGKSPGEPAAHAYGDCLLRADRCRDAPASGWLADKVGVRNIFFTAIVLFTAGSLCCAMANTLDQLVMARVLQGVGGAMMVPVGRLTVMKIVPREQYMAAMTFVTLPVGPLLGPALGGILVEYASAALDFPHQPAGGHYWRYRHRALMPNYTLQTRRFDVVGFLLLATGMATLTLALDGQKGWESH